MSRNIHEDPPKYDPKFGQIGGLQNQEETQSAVESALKGSSDLSGDEFIERKEEITSWLHVTQGLDIE